MEGQIFWNNDYIYSVCTYSSTNTFNISLSVTSFTQCLHPPKMTQKDVTAKIAWTEIASTTTSLGSNGQLQLQSHLLMHLEYRAGSIHPHTRCINKQWWRLHNRGLSSNYTSIQTLRGNACYCHLLSLLSQYSVQ